MTVVFDSTPVVILTPFNIQQAHDVEMMSMRRRHVASTSV